QRIVEQWKRMGVASATTFHTKDRSKANNDKEFLAIMKKATGVWFGGGRQWNFADSYYGTESHRLMKAVLAKGGVIGGSSAGASIQGGYLARANPVANFDIMAPGYERGLGFLPGVAIDQHFSQRGRQKDMTQLANRYPQLLGIGIDETTAIRVQGSIADVIGKGKVFFYDRRNPVIPGKDDYTSLSAGQHFDLVERKVIEESSSED
ncbi:MAG: cyanophycinase, partial [Planctomycetota bacterium]